MTGNCCGKSKLNPCQRLRTQFLGRSAGCALCLGFGRSEAVGLGSDLDDVAAEGARSESRMVPTASAAGREERPGPGERVVSSAVVVVVQALVEVVGPAAGPSAELGDVVLGEAVGGELVVVRPVRSGEAVA